MDLQTLESEYDAARQTDAFEVHARLLKTLLASDAPELIAYHYELLRHREPRDLYLRLRAGFVKRGEAGAQFLCDRATTEDHPRMRADLLHLLGRMRHPTALPLARQALESEDPELRRCGCYVLGWMGQVEDVARLGERLMADRDPSVRETAATAHSQFYERLPAAKAQLLENLEQALQRENSDKVTGWIVVSTQYILGKRFGLRENIAEAELQGDIAKAKQRCLKAFVQLASSPPSRAK